MKLEGEHHESSIGDSRCGRALHARRSTDSAGANCRWRGRWRGGNHRDRTPTRGGAAGCADLGLCIVRRPAWSARALPTCKRLQYQTPSLAITSTFSQRNVVAFALRGQRTQETQLFTDPPVGTYFAEVVQPRPYGFGNALYDFESVQVLKGVQGTLFGRNMTGGAVLVEPHHPELGETSGEMRVGYGSEEMKELYGMVNLPVGEQFAIRFAGKSRERDGWAREVSTGRDYDNQNFDSARLSALFQSGDFETLTIGDWYRSKEHGTAAFMTSLVLPSVISNYEGLRQAGVITTNVPAEFAAARQLFASNEYTLDMGAGEGGNLDAFGAPYEDVENYGITNKTTWKLSDALTIKNVAGYRKNTRDVVQDFDGIPAFLITPNQFARHREL